MPRQFQAWVNFVFDFDPHDGGLAALIAFGTGAAAADVFDGRGRAFGRAKATQIQALRRAFMVFDQAGEGHGLAPLLDAELAFVLAGHEAADPIGQLQDFNSRLGQIGFEVVEAALFHALTMTGFRIFGARSSRLLQCENCDSWDQTKAVPRNRATPDCLVFRHRTDRVLSAIPDPRLER